MRGLVPVLALAASASAAAPTVEYLYPSGGQQGTTVTVTAGGKFDAWPVQFWADHPGITAEISKEKGKLSVKIDKTVAPAPHLVRLYDAQGPSTPHVFFVGARPEAMEAEPNDEVSKAQPIETVPVTLNGRLEKPGDVDSFAVKLEPGQCLWAAAKSRRLGSPMDPLLHLYDAAGNQLAFTHDGLGLDPLLVHRAQKPGTYVVRLAAFKFPPAAEVRLAGEARDVYRLTLSTEPLARYAIPAAAKRGETSRPKLFGWNGEELPAGAVTDWLDLAVSDAPEHVEAETASLFSAPCAVTGRLARPGEEDAFRFGARKGDRIVIELAAAAVASPMDPVLRVEDESGKELAANDDLGGQAGNARLEFAAPADGMYRAVVSDRFGNGGHEYVYRLSLSPPAPRVVATADADEYRVATGKTAAVKLKVERHNGHAAGLVAVATGLPGGVSATSAEVPEKGGDVTLTLTAAADAKPAAGPFRVMLLGTDPAHPLAHVASANLRKEAGQELIPRTEALWLTVTPP